jgi:hypothetical protein
MFTKPKLYMSGLAVVALIAALVLEPAAQGQNSRQNRPETVKTQPLHSQGLSPEPLVADTLGLKMNLPAGVHKFAEKFQGQMTVTVSDDDASPTWTMRISSLTSTLPQPSAQAQIDDLLRDLKESKQAFKLLSNRPTTYGGVDGRLCYLQRTAQDKQQYASGWLILPTGESTFLVFAIQTLPEHLPKLQPLLEASFATIQLRTGAEVVADRKTKLDAGKALLTSIKPEDLRSLVGQKQWHRIYRPADASQGAAETELGYSLVEILAAKRGALDPAKPEKNYSAMEREDGIMVRVQGRGIMDLQRKKFYDTIALYWMAWDQSEEAWSVRATQRQGEAEASASETGLRAVPQSASEGLPKLQVIKRTADKDSVPYEWEVPDGYMSQAMGWLVGRLLPRDITEPRDYAYYWYVPNDLAPKVYLRLDRWAPATDGSGKWLLTTRLTSDTPPFTSTYNRDGKLLRRVHSDGSITEPIELENLNRIWKSKGLDVKSSLR